MFDRLSWLRPYVPILAIPLVAIACGAGERGDSDAETSEAAPRVALLTAGPVSDAGWYAGAYQGLMMIRDSLGWEVSHQQTRTPAEFDEAFLSYANAGYDLVFAHGSEYQDAAIRAGAAHPDLTIVVSGGGRVSENVAPLIFTLWDATYLAGMLAGGMTESDTIGMVGGVAIPPAVGTFRAFEAGALAANPDVTVLEAFTGNWDDVAAAKEAALAQVRRGADVLVHNTDGASFGVFQAVREERARGREVWAMGMNADQNEVAPDVILGSAVIRIPEAFLEVARRWERGEIGGAPVYEGMRQGKVDLVTNPALADRLPQEVLDRIRTARQSIVAGELEVPSVPFVEDTTTVGGG